MQIKFLIATASLALVAACGGPEAGRDDAPDAEPTEASTAETVPASPPATVAGEEAGASAPAAASIAASATPPASFAQCRACHSVEPGKNGIGPTLFGIVGSKAGEVEGFRFSPALAKSGITWDRASLDTWLAGPMKMVPGTRMVIAQPDAAKRQEIIDYLETLK